MSMPKEKDPTLASLLGSSFALLQHGMDRAIEWGFGKIKESGEKIPVLSRKDRFADLEPNRTGVSLGRWLRGVITGKHADDAPELAEERKALATSPDSAGGHTIPKPLLAEFVDLLRAHGEAYRAYRRRVSMVVPLPPKDEAEERGAGDADRMLGGAERGGGVPASEPVRGSAGTKSPGLGIRCVWASILAAPRSQRLF